VRKGSKIALFTEHQNLFELNLDGNFIFYVFHIIPLWHNIG